MTLHVADLVMVPHDGTETVGLVVDVVDGEAWLVFTHRGTRQTWVPDTAVLTEAFPGDDADMALRRAIDAARLHVINASGEQERMRASDPARAQLVDLILALDELSTACARRIIHLAPPVDPLPDRYLDMAARSTARSAAAVAHLRPAPARPVAAMAIVDTPATRAAHSTRLVD